MTGRIVQAEPDTLALLALCSQTGAPPADIYDAIRASDAGTIRRAGPSTRRLLTRGICPVCGEDRSLAPGGVLRTHPRTGRRCLGSRRRPITPTTPETPR